MFSIRKAENLAGCLEKSSDSYLPNIEWLLAGWGAFVGNYWCFFFLNEKTNLIFVSEHVLSRTLYVLSYLLLIAQFSKETRAECLTVWNS